MKSFINNVLSNILAMPIVSLLSIIGACLFAAIKLHLPVFLSVIITSFIWLIAIALLYTKRIFGSTNYKWDYYQWYEKHVLILEKEKGIDRQLLKTTKNRERGSEIKGFFDWEDVSVKELKLSAKGAKIELNLKSAGNKITTRKTNDMISIRNDPIYADYCVKFNDDDPKDVQIEIQFDYYKDIVKPVYYYEVYRPAVFLQLELRVDDNLKIHNVKKCIATKYGDRNHKVQKRIKKKRLKDNPGKSVYTVRIWNPKLFYVYSIEWEWIQ